MARVELGAQNYNQSCTFDGKPSVGLSIYQLPGTNALDVADRVRAKMEELKTRFPDGVDYQIAYDTTPFIRESVNDVIKTLFEAVILVGIVVLVFLQDWKAMILPMIDVPVSLIGTFAVMAALGFSLNNLTLFGLVLAIGIVVDDAIVVLENTERMIAKGFDARTATIKAMEEITGPILAITLALSSVFIPCCFITGITGQFFRQFAVTIAVSTIISAVNALTMTPSRAVMIFKTEEGAHGHEFKREALPWWSFGILGGFLTLWLGPEHLAGPAWLGLSRRLGGACRLAEAARELSWAATAVYFAPGMVAGLVVGWSIIRPVNAVLGWLFRGFNRLFDGMTGAYGWMVGKSLRMSVMVLMIYGGLLVLTYGTFRRAPLGFIPEQDQGRLILSVQLPDSASLQRTQEQLAIVEKICLETPGVAHTVGLAGMSFLLQANASNFGSMFIVLDEFDERQAPELTADGIMARLRKEFKARVKDADVAVRNSSAIPGLGTAGGYKLIIEDRGGRGFVDLQRETDELVAAMKKQPGLATASTQFRSRTPQLYLDIDRTKAESLGLSFDDVNQTLSMYLGSLYVNSFNQFGRHWQVTVQLEGDFRNRVEDINLLQVRNKWGQMVPLGTLIRVREVGGPVSVTRYNLYTASQITGSLAPGVSSGETIKAIDRLTDATLPISMKAEWTEVMFLQIKAGNTAMYVFALSVVSVFLALAALYESWALPLAVILVVPMCLLCSLLGVLSTGREVNIFVQIGLVVLVGLACKNAILIVEYAKQKHMQGLPRYEATLEACRLRLRPILMTSFAFIIGVVPLMVASGAGAEMRRSLGIAVFSGMVGVTLFGVFLTPVFFSVIQGLSETRLFSARTTRWVGSTLAGGLLGGGIGYLLVRLNIVRSQWAETVGVRRDDVDADRDGHPQPAPVHRSPAPRPPGLNRPPARGAGSTRPEGMTCDLEVLHRPSGLRHRALAGDRAGGGRGRVHAAGGAVSRGDAPHGAGDGHLPGGECHDGPEHRRGADRGAGQRRREHDVHVVAMHQRRLVHVDCHLPAGHGHRHGPGAGAEPRLAGAAGHPSAGAERGDQRQEDVAEHDDDREPALAGRPVRQYVPEQLRHDLHQGRAGAAPRRRGHHLPRPARLQPAGLARPGQAGGAEPERHGRGHRGLPAEPPGRRRADRPAAGPDGPAIPAHDQHPGPPRRPRGIRRHHHQGRSRDAPVLSGWRWRWRWRCPTWAGAGRGGGSPRRQECTRGADSSFQGSRPTRAAPTARAAR